MSSSILEVLAPEYNVLTFNDVFESAESLQDFCSDSGLLEAEIPSSFIEKLWFMLYAKYGNDPIAGADENQWKYRLLMKINAYTPTFLKKEEIQKALRALSIDDLREGYKSIFNHAINPSTTPSTDNTEELPYISDQNVNKTKKNKADAYLSLWEILRSNLWEEYISRFSSLFSKIASTGVRVVYTEDN